MAGTLSKPCRMPAWDAFSFCSRTPGPRPGITSAASCRSEMLDVLARVLKPGAELRFATDDKSYLPYALERLCAHPAFDWLAAGPATGKAGRPTGRRPAMKPRRSKACPPFFAFVRRATMPAMLNREPGPPPSIWKKARSTAPNWAISASSWWLPVVTIVIILMVLSAVPLCQAGTATGPSSEKAQALAGQTRAAEGNRQSRGERRGRSRYFTGQDATSA